MDMKKFQETLIEDLVGLRDGTVSVSEARARGLMARNIIEAEKVDLTRRHMEANGTITAAGARLRLAS
jgi:hypothetical protein